MLENWIESLGKTLKKNTWYSFFKKLLNKNKYEIEENTKLLITLRWSWNTLILMLRLF